MLLIERFIPGKVLEWSCLYKLIPARGKRILAEAGRISAKQEYLRREGEYPREARIPTKAGQIPARSKNTHKSNSPRNIRKQDMDLTNHVLFLNLTMHCCLCFVPWNGVALAFCTKNTRGCIVGIGVLIVADLRDYFFCIVTRIVAIKL